MHAVLKSVADALSCIEANTLTRNFTPVIDFDLMAKAQLTDPELQHLLANLQASSLQIAPYTLDTGGPPLFILQHLNKHSSTLCPRTATQARIYNIPLALTHWYLSYRASN